ncbi:hypothetical protein P154DRAFT_530466 [Amniculicola lignicola CBS 123094]|uniref:F-box domain-containing protein n=1 Tax=Amniculicola lignicola CBS 123094 TaxID=1392246 RepID=A0A6A5WUY7_9PLEO|nr:hypothetical protein P154DRAFT_530466 [Amniculicola lignicola CBS 123094]
MASAVKRFGGVVFSRGAAWRSLKRVVSRKGRSTPVSADTKPLADGANGEEDNEAPRAPPPEALIFPTENYDHNVEHSFLYRLPIELVLMVADVLPPSAIIALRLTGRKLSNLLKNPEPTEIDAYDRKVFGSVMVEDSYQWHCRRETIFGLSSTSKSPCRGCRTVRQQSHFTPTQLEKASHERLCRGHEGGLKLCEHTALCYEDVVALKDKRMAAKSDWTSHVRICTHPSHGTTPEELLFHAPMITVNEDLTIIISQTSALIRLPRKALPKKKLFQDALKDSNVSFCQHVSLNDVDSFLPNPSNRPWIVQPSDFPFYPSFLDPCTTECNQGACKKCLSLRQRCQECPWRDCQTSWRIYRRHHDPAVELDEIMICWRWEIMPTFWREISPISLTWLAHLSPEPRESLDFCVDGEAFLKMYPEISADAIRLRARGMLAVYGGKNADLTGRRYRQ